MGVASIVRAMNGALGADLSKSDQTYVLSAYVHRFTGNHKPAWMATGRPDGTPYPLQFASDADWLSNTRFAVTKSGALDRRIDECYSSPTWPNNPELRAKYGKAA